MRRTHTLLLAALLALACVPAHGQAKPRERVVAVNSTPTPGTCNADRLYKLIVAPYTVWTGGAAGVCTVVGAGDALTSGKLSQFASTTSAELAGVLSDETGSGGGFVRATGPTLSGPLGIVKSDVGLGNVDNTSDANKPVSTAQQTALNLKEATANKDAVSGYAGLDGSTLLKAAEFPAFTGDATKAAGSLVTVVAKVNGNTPGGTCTNQFVRSLNTSAVPTCATITPADLPTQTWTACTFANSYANGGGGNDTCGYLQHADGLVEVKGTVGTGTPNTTIFTLPVGMRPLGGTRYFPAMTSGAFVYIQVGTNGAVLVPSYTTSVTLSFMFTP
jgi:hypothetical protein